jgi:hypothetical protein
LTGVAPPGLLGSPLGTIGVKIFFVTSGDLVTKSWLSDPRVGAFAMRRASPAIRSRRSSISRRGSRWKAASTPPRAPSLPAAATR